MRLRVGFSLVELCVTLAVGGLVLLLVVILGVREQRAHESVGQLLGALAPLREGTSIVPVDLRALAPGAGDVLEASDTALDIQATIGGGVVCATTPQSVALVPHAIRDFTLSSLSSMPELGDSLRLLAASDSTERWIAVGVRSASLMTNACAGDRSFAIDPTEQMSPALVLALLDTIPPNVGAGTPVRVTRRERYSIYRAGDGAWYLGLREWNGASARFDVVQPLSGPFASPLASGTGFRFIDSLGSAAVPDTRAIRGVELTLVAASPRGVRIPGMATTRMGTRTESTTVLVTPRNGR